MTNAAVIIHTRTKHIGFRSGLLAQPCDMTESMAQYFKNYICALTESVEEIRSNHEYRKVVLSEKGYVVMGICGYLHDIYSDFVFKDEASRDVYGFVGFVWKRDDFIHQDNIGFPCIKSFGSVLQEHVVPNWDKSKNSLWADEVIKTNYTCTVQSEKSNFHTLAKIPAKTSGKVVILTCTADEALNVVLYRISQGEDVSVATNFSYKTDAINSGFTYAVMQVKTDETSINDKVSSTRNRESFTTIETKVEENTPDLLVPQKSTDEHKRVVVSVCGVLGLLALALILFFIPGIILKLVIGGMLFLVLAILFVVLCIKKLNDNSSSQNNAQQKETLTIFTEHKNDKKETEVVTATDASVDKKAKKDNIFDL